LKNFSASLRAEKCEKGLHNQILLVAHDNEQPISFWLLVALDNIPLSFFAGLLPRSTHRNRKNKSCAFSASRYYPSISALAQCYRS
jgi:hypothetical protein